MGIEWIVFGTVWAVMAGYSYADACTRWSDQIAVIDMWVWALISMALAPLTFGLCLRYSLSRE